MSKLTVVLFSAVIVGTLFWLVIAVNGVDFAGKLDNGAGPIDEIHELLE